MPVAMRVLKNLDIVLLVCALPIFIGADLPILGWIGGSAAYVGQRVIGELLNKSASMAEDMSGVLGVMVGGTIARGFLVALSIFGVGMIDNDAGASAGFLFLAAFTVYFTMALVLRPHMKGGQK
ncbi:MAG TPA: hypothetical protein VN606_13965 [Thermoleophilaceae bacterium]|jgi:hypothetical protein|nr:hypothetical protein [Thermoleophilaceae bacterium]